MNLRLPQLPPEGRHWLRFGFGVKINFILGLGLALLLAVGVLASRSIDTLLETGRDETATQARIAQLEATLASLRGAVASQRSFLLTRRDSDLYNYRAEREQVGRELEALRARAQDAEQMRRARRFAAAVAVRLQRLDEILDARERLGAGAAIALLERPPNAGLDAGINAAAEALRLGELRALYYRKANTERDADNSAFLVAWGSAFACALLLWAMVVIHRYQGLRRAAERALRQSEAQLRLITDSVPALIAHADGGGRLLFHNRRMQDWFGRPGTLKGATLRELFGEEAYRALAPGVAGVLRGGAAALVFSVRSADGAWRELSAQLVPEQDEGGAVSGFYALFTDVTALKQVERMKSKFVTTVSHELRTPLTSIRGSLGLVAAGVAGALPAKAGELVGIAVQNCERLVRLVNDVLDSERMLSGTLSFRFEPVELAPLIERSMSETESYAADLGVQLSFERPAQALSVRGDADRLVQVVTNLLSNASKFSPEGGSVTVGVEAGGEGMLRVAVSDRGPGLPPGAERQLFERFAQVDGAEPRRAGGTGLGLSICREIVERLGGRIGYLPRPGGGSIFYFELPALQGGAAR